MLKKIAVLVSGGGTNLQAILDYPLVYGKVALVVSSKPSAYALERAKKANVKTAVVDAKKCSCKWEFESGILAELEAEEIDVVVLAGFMHVLSKAFVDAYKDRMVNVHPSLIPAFCGDGYYGLRVHQEALKRGVKVTGATVHLVNEITDGGRILAQKAVEVNEGDTPETLQKRVMEQAEWVLLPAAVDELCKGL